MRYMGTCSRNRQSRVLINLLYFVDLFGFIHSIVLDDTECVYLEIPNAEFSGYSYGVLYSSR